MSSSCSSLDWVLSHWAHFTVHRSINQSFYLLITHQAVKQHQHQDETSRTARHQVHLWLTL